MKPRDRFGLLFGNAYDGVLDEWGMQVDQEDSSTAPFSTFAAMHAEELLQASDECITVAAE